MAMAAAGHDMTMPAMPTAPQVGPDDVLGAMPSEGLDVELQHVSTTSVQGSSAEALRTSAVANEASSGQEVAVVKTHTVGQQKEGGVYAVKASHVTRIPRSAWGVAAVMPILAEVHTCGDWFRVCFLSYFCLCLSAGAQLAFVYGIKSITLEGVDATCDDLAMHANLVLLCIIIYLLTVFNDIEETFDLAEVYWDMIPTVPGRSEVLYFDDDNKIVAGGMSFTRKALLGVFVLLLKFLVAVLFGIHGTVYLASSATDDELLLNTLALEFVLGVDEMVYTSLAPTSTRSIMLQVPPFRTEKRRAFFRYVDSISPINKILFSMWASRWTMFAVNPATAECIAHLPGWMQREDAN